MRWAGRTCEGTLEGTVGFRKPFVGDTVKSGSRGPTTLHRGSLCRFQGTAPIPASSGEGNGEPVRHRLNQPGNRATNAVLHRSIDQLPVTCLAFGLSGGGNRQICITDNGVVASYHWPSSPSGGAYTDLQLRSYTNHPDNTSFQPPAPPSNATQ